MSFLKQLLFLALISLVLCQDNCYKEVFNRIGQKQAGPSQKTFEKAVKECNKTKACKTITYMNTATSGFVYKLLTDSIKATLPKGAKTWEKTSCLSPPQKNECSFIKQERTTFSECAQECKMYKNLSEAQAACKSDVFCGGITFTNQEYSIFLFAFFEGNWGYQLRGGQLLNSQDSKIFSYEKTGCAQEDRCKYSAFQVGQSLGCVKGCKDFSTLDEAKSACNMDENCNAVTFTSTANGGPSSTGAAGNGQGNQLRSNSTVINNGKGGITYLKSCQKLCTPKDDEILVVNSTPSIHIGSGQIIKESSCQPIQSQGSYLEGCVDECRDYKTLNEALLHCQNNNLCQGITYSKKENGGKNSYGPLDNGYGYQLRSGQKFSASHIGETSWMKCIDNSSSLCLYKEDKNKYLNQSTFIPSQSFKTYLDACGYCDVQSSCKGIQYDPANNNYTPVTNVSNYSDKNQGTIYIKDRCNNYNNNNNNNYSNSFLPQVYNDLNKSQPVVSSKYSSNNVLMDLYSECNYKGTKYRANPTVQSIDLRQYKSMSIPQGYSVQIYPKSNYQGTYQIVDKSVACQPVSLATFYSTTQYASLRLKQNS